MKTLRIPLLLVLFVAILYCGLQIYRLEAHRRIIKEDLIELMNIRYGLFSVDEWKGVISTVLTRKVEELDFTPEQRTKARADISSFLYRTLDDFEKRFYEEKSKSVIGWIQGGITSLTGMFDKIKKDVPVFTDQILDFMQNEGNREKIKEFIMDKLSGYADKTFSKIDYTEHNLIIERYGFGDRVETIQYMQAEIDRIGQISSTYMYVIMGLVLLGVMLLLLSGRLANVEFLLNTCICFSLLALGLLLPMIEIDARIQEISFTLLDEPVSFTDQVLYYKSKSILEVVHLMLTQGKADVMAVGFLVLLFSVIFPLTKLMASIAYVYWPSLKKSKFVRLMVFRTGKWSMADVMVVAIFMSYIGFSSILTEQLRQLETITRTIDIVATNQSALQTGFFLFTSFVILSLLVAHRLQFRRAKAEA
jgi:hypothetical protein